jgi:hypothetical protein
MCAPLDFKLLGNGLYEATRGTFDGIEPMNLADQPFQNSANPVESGVAKCRLAKMRHSAL